MIVGLNDIAERAASQPLNKLIAVAYVVMLGPQIVAFQIIISGCAALVLQANVVDCLLVDYLYSFEFAEELTVLFENLFAIDTWELACESVLNEVRAAGRLQP